MMSRGQRKDKIYLDCNDKTKFIDKLKETICRFSIKIHCYCLMDNHYHLLIETPHGNLSKAMHYLNTSYANYFKVRHSLVGSVFQGRYKAILLEDDSYFFVLSSYIHLNPLRSGMVQDLRDYKWNSVHQYTNRKCDEMWLTRDLILNKINPDTYSSTLAKWNMENKNISRKKIYGCNDILGSEQFYESVVKRVKELVNQTGQPTCDFENSQQLFQLTREDGEASIVDLYNINKRIVYQNIKGNVYKKIMIYGLKKYTAMPVKRIGEIFNITSQAVTISVKRLENEMQSNKKIFDMVMKFEKLMKRLM